MLKYIQSRCTASKFSVRDGLPHPDLSFLLTKLKNYNTDEYSTLDNDGMSVPPMACSFAKMAGMQHILSVVDEDGSLVLYNTHMTGRAAVLKNWQVHANAVFDLEWMQNESKMLTGSGDQTVALWDVELSRKLETFRGHTSSIKSISGRVGDDAVFASGSRDGHIMTWDNRVAHKDGAIKPIDTMYNAHSMQSTLTPGKARRKKVPAWFKDTQQSVTAVLFQNENYLVSAGAVDGHIKVWDIRKTYKTSMGPVPVRVLPYPGNNVRKHGYSNLTFDPCGMNLYANCTDDTIYKYNMLSDKDRPVSCFRGHKNSTFYVKSAISPDNQYLLSGSSDEDAYIWQVNKPEIPPIVLKSHTAEVTGVAWCPDDLTKLVTVSDDTKTKFWRIYCREMKKRVLPTWVGRARRISKEQGTDPSSPSPALSKSTATTSLLTSPSASPKPISRSPSIKDWLKRKAASNASCSENGSLPCKCPRLDSKTQTSVLPCHGIKRNHDEVSCSEKMASDVDKVQRAHSCECINAEVNERNTTDVCSGKRIKLEPQGDGLDQAVVGDRSTNVSCAEIPSASQSLSGSNISSSECVSSKLSSPSKCRLKNSENDPYLSPHKSLKRQLNTPHSPVCSPKRPCLTSLLSNGNRLQDTEGLQLRQSAKVALFSDSPKLVDSDIKPSGKESCNLPFSKYVKCNSSDSSPVKDPLKNNNNSPVSDSLINPGRKDFSGVDRNMCTPPKGVLQFKVTEEYSPTLRLPNLVMDGLVSAGHTPPRAPRTTKGKVKQDWLTRIRLEKLKSCETTQVEESLGKAVPRSRSPKLVKGIKKIQSFFKRKEESEK